MTKRTYRSLFFVAMALGAVLTLSWTAEAQTPFEVKDIRLGTDDAYPDSLTDVNGTLFFVVYPPPNYSGQLWKSDGTAAGTVLVKDIDPTGYYGSAYDLTNVNGTLFFIAYAYPNYSAQLWKSDGTAAGTVLVKDIDPTGSGDAYSLTNANGTLFFVGSDPVNGYELWKSDGTTAGTFLVKDIVPGGGGSNPSNLTNANGTLFFRANDGASGSELWKSDGTDAGTVLVKDIYPGSLSSNPGDLTNVNGTLVFRAYENINGYRLWKTDGTTGGTVIVSPTPYYPYHIANVNGTLFFSASDSTNGYELWKSDGTAAGTIVVKDIYPGFNSSYPHDLTNVNGTLFFGASDGVTGDELWKSDGTPGGTVLVQDVLPGIDSSNISYLTNVNGSLFFTARDSLANGYELWKSDGSAAGTVMVKDILPGSSSEPDWLVAVGPTLFFTANDGTTGYELWKSDGTVSGTVEVVDLNQLAASSDPYYLTDLNGSLLFNADDGILGPELWKSDGSAPGTTILKDIAPQGQRGYPRYLTTVNDNVFFSAYDGASGSRLWKTDGTTGGTVIVNPTPSSPSNLANVNGTLFFTAYDSSNNIGYELWKSDGTDAGTVLVKDINPGSLSSYPSSLTNVNGTLFFAASDGVNGTELWKSDGTAAGTVLVKDILPGSGNSTLSNLTNSNGTLFFRANDGTSGYELWKSDGTAAGTVLVKDIYPGITSSYPYYLTNVNGTLFFAANDVNGTELWKTDGTTGGTVIVNPTAEDPYYMANVNGTLFFQAYSYGNGYELWKSDGTAAGTVLVGDIAVGAASSSPTNLTLSGSVLFFVADDGVTGRELWAVVVSVPAISVGDCSVTEGNSGTQPCTLTVSLSTGSIQTVSVNFATADGTAVNGLDYFGGSGALTFPPGTTVQAIPASVVGDLLDEPDETFFLNLSSPTNATIADAQGQATILDDDAAPTLSVGDCAVIEGDAGSTPCAFLATLSAPSSFGVSASFATADGSATSGVDYAPASGTFSFAPLSTSQAISAGVLGDVAVELDETFFLNLSAPTNATLGDGQGLGTILDDDAASLTTLELSHGSRHTADLAGGAPDLYRIQQQPLSSYEVVVDAASGDVAAGLLLQRLAADNVTVLENGTPVAGGASLGLRFENPFTLPVSSQHVRVSAGTCGGSCGPEDVYRIRAWDTTLSLARFNNSATQITVLVLHNEQGVGLSGHVHFWKASGGLLVSQAFALAPRATLTLNTASLAGLTGQSGSLTVSHDGTYHAVSGKAVAVEPATGFTFDTALQSRPR